jgi:superfamily II RNA helicase
MEDKVEKLINKAEKRLSKRLKIDIEDYNHDSSMSYKQFLKNLLKEVVIQKPTLFLEGKRVGQKQTSKNKGRSIGDLYLISKNYYPDITIQEIREILWDLYQNKKLRRWFCYVHNKIMYKWGYNMWETETSPDEYQLPWSNPKKQEKKLECTI